MVLAQKLKNNDAYLWYVGLLSQRKMPTGLVAWDNPPKIHIGEQICLVSLKGGICKSTFEGTNTLRQHVRKAHPETILKDRKGQGSAEDVIDAKEYFNALQLANVTNKVAEATTAVQEFAAKNNSHTASSSPSPSPSPAPEPARKAPVSNKNKTPAKKTTAKKTTAKVSKVAKPATRASRRRKSAATAVDDE